MATLVLSTLGTALGGPVGGALGSIVGQSIDRNLFGPSTRRGPRLGDLTVQTSSYGSPIARIYGRMRVAGTVVWAADLREEEVASAAGKGAAGAVSYVYSASFAVALSSRRTAAVGRIWADGKLLRGSDGLFQSAVQFRFHRGTEDQPVDPLIASIEGSDGSPAFRGTAIAVFEDLALADFGNRIPSLTFELIADEEAPRVGDVISDVSNGRIEASSDPLTVVGFAALGSDQRSAVEPLVELSGGHYFDDGDSLRASARDGEPLFVGDPVSSGCCVGEDRPAARLERHQDAADSLPVAVTIDYYDPQRDYQAGQMRATAGGQGRSVRRIDSASAIAAETAKSLAECALARRWSGRDRVTLRLSPSFITLRPGQLLIIDETPGKYRVEQVTIDGLVVIVEARRTATSIVAPAADAGRAAANPAVAIGASVPKLLDLPLTGVELADGFGVMLAVGSRGRFRPLTVSIEANGQPITTIAVDRPSITGVATSTLGVGVTSGIDAQNRVEIVLSSAERPLYHASDDALAMGANAMIIGDEIIQFGRATSRGEGAYRLSHLIRGCRGTEWAIGEHHAGERLVLLQGDCRPVRLDPAMIGATITARAYGRGDDPADPPSASCEANGENLRPLSPCHLGAVSNGSSVALRWTPRRWSSLNWSGDDVASNGSPLFEVSARAGGQSISADVQDATHLFAVADLQALGEPTILFEVVERGVLPSRPARLTWKLEE